MRTLCVIPARLGSSRLAHKPLQVIAHQPLIRLVAQRALDLECFDHVVVAADDQRVCAAVQELDVEAVLTGDHRSGTERVAAVVALERFADAEIVVNLQGDEPFVSKEAVVGAVDRVWAGAGIGTAGAPLGETERHDRNAVKVLVDSEGWAVGFTRNGSFQIPAGGAVLKHVGLYAYRPSALRRWTAAQPVAEERAESLEQLRPLSRGEQIAVATQTEPAGPGIDTAADLRTAEHFLSVSC